MVCLYRIVVLATSEKTHLFYKKVVAEQQRRNAELVHVHKRKYFYSVDFNWRVVCCKTKLRVYFCIQTESEFKYRVINGCGKTKTLTVKWVSVLTKLHFTSGNLRKPFVACGARSRIREKFEVSRSSNTPNGRRVIQIRFHEHFPSWPLFKEIKNQHNQSW